MFIKSCETAYLNGEEYSDLLSAQNVTSKLFAIVHDRRLEQLAMNAFDALSALISCDNIQIAEREEEE